MAKTAAPAGPGEPSEKSSGLLGFIMAMLIATVVAGVGGGLFGMYGTGSASRSMEKKAPEPAEGGKQAFAGKLNLKSLSPIVTNLSSPTGIWIRLEAAIVVDKENVKEEGILAGKISEDIVAFLRTVPLGQIEGANGFQHLREDLNDRARVRSEGKVREVIIQSLIVE